MWLANYAMYNANQVTMGCGRARDVGMEPQIPLTQDTIKKKCKPSKKPRKDEKRKPSKEAREV
jgi:hypothetical protein